MNRAPPPSNVGNRPKQKQNHRSVKWRWTLQSSSLLHCPSPCCPPLRMPSVPSCAPAERYRALWTARRKRGSTSDLLSSHLTARSTPERCECTRRIRELTSSSNWEINGASSQIEIHKLCHHAEYAHMKSAFTAFIVALINQSQVASN